MKRLTILIALVGLFSMACKQIVYRKYEMTDPRMETMGSLRDYMISKNYRMPNACIFKDSTTYFKTLNDTIFKYRLLGTMLFDKDLHLVLPDSTKCQWSGGNFVKQLKKDSAYRVDPRFDLQLLCSELIMLADSLPMKIPAPGEYDFIVLNKWAKFIGKMNERLVYVSTAVDERKDLRILNIYLNIDMQKSWDLREDQRLKID